MVRFTQVWHGLCCVGDGGDIKNPKLYACWFPDGCGEWCFNQTLGSKPPGATNIHVLAALLKTESVQEMKGDECLTRGQMSA